MDSRTQVGRLPDHCPAENAGPGPRAPHTAPTRSRTNAAVGERGAFMGWLSMAFGSRREEPNGSREDREGRGVTYVCSKGVHPRGRKSLSGEDNCGQEGYPLRARGAPPEGGEILLRHPHQRAKAVGASAPALLATAAGVGLACGLDLPREQVNDPQHCDLRMLFACTLCWSLSRKSTDHNRF